MRRRSSSRSTSLRKASARARSRSTSSSATPECSTRGDAVDRHREDGRGAAGARRPLHRDPGHVLRRGPGARGRDRAGLGRPAFHGDPRRPRREGYLLPRLFTRSSRTARRSSSKSSSVMARVASGSRTSSRCSRRSSASRRCAATSNHARGAGPHAEYARSGDADLAYRVVDDGPPDIVLIYDWASHIEAVAEQPIFEEFVRSLARFSRVVWFDMRGIGMSAPVVGDVPIESWMDDLVAVMDAAEVGTGDAGRPGRTVQMAVMAAASHPERVGSLVLVSGRYARFARAKRPPAWMPLTVRTSTASRSRRGRTRTSSARAVRLRRAGIVEWWGRVRRFRATPVRARSRLDSITRARPAARPAPRRRPLVVHNLEQRSSSGRPRSLPRRADPRRTAGGAGQRRPLAAPGARPPVHDRGVRHRFAQAVHDSDHFLATVLFVDVVGSTERLAEQGDAVGVVLDRFERVVRGSLTLYGAILADTAGDGIRSGVRAAPLGRFAAPVTSVTRFAEARGTQRPPLRAR